MSAAEMTSKARVHDHRQHQRAGEGNERVHHEGDGEDHDAALESLGRVGDREGRRGKRNRSLRCAQHEGEDGHQHPAVCRFFRDAGRGDRQAEQGAFAARAWGEGIDEHVPALVGGAQALGDDANEQARDEGHRGRRDLARSDAAEPRTAGSRSSRPRAR